MKNETVIGRVTSIMGSGEDKVESFAFETYDARKMVFIINEKCATVPEPGKEITISYPPSALKVIKENFPPHINDWEIVNVGVLDKSRIQKPKEIKIHEFSANQMRRLGEIFKKADSVNRLSIILSDEQPLPFFTSVEYTENGNTISAALDREG